MAVKQNGNNRSGVQHAPMPANLNPALYEEPILMKRCARDPNWDIQVFRINSDDIKEYLEKKVRCYAPNANVEVHPRYIENRLSRKNRDDISRAQSATTQAYASLLIALSADTIDHGHTDPAYRWVTEGANADVKVIKEIYVDLIRKFRFNRESLKNLLKDYKALDHLKERFGITEEYLRTLVNTSNPVRYPGTKGDDDGWVYFAASADRIIEDYLTENTIWKPKQSQINSNNPDASALKTVVVSHPSPAGRFEIVRVNKISQDLVEFVVYLHQGEFRSSDNPELRKLFDSFK